MSIASAEQYAAMLDAAAAGGYAYPAINVTSSQTLNAALRGFAQAESDGIVQVTTGAAKYLSGAAGDEAAGARALAAYAREVSVRYGNLIALHTDHCPPDHVDGFLRPLLAEANRRRQSGEEPLFQSQMFDGSSLPLRENLRRSAVLLDECAAANVVLEVEVGVVGGTEDDVSGEAVATRKRYTTIDDLLSVAKMLGTGERGRYLLAATFGNVHGAYAPGSVQLRPEILDQGQRALAESHPGARFRYVFHGSSGSSNDELRDAVRYGVVKVNLDTDNQYAFTRAVADHVLANREGLVTPDGGAADKSAFDPRAWGRKGEAAMAARVAAACEQLGSARKSVAL
jgi:fructose-bisphosphate aldolase class II